MSTKLTGKELEQLIDDFLTDNELELVHTSSGAAITPPSYDGDWTIRRSWMNEESRRKTLKGAVAVASREPSE